MMPGIIPSLLMNSAPVLSVVITPDHQTWPSSAPFRVTTKAEVTGGVPPYAYGWNDTGPLPVDGHYAGQTKTWQPSGAGPSDAFVSILVTDAIGQTAIASSIIGMPW